MPNLTQPKNLIAPVLILLLAAMLRLPFADTYVLWADEFSVMNHGIQIGLEGQQRLIGTQATFQGLTHHSPFTSYLVALPFALFSDPAMARVFVALPGIIAVAVCYAMMHRYFGRRAAIIAGLLVATMPLLIYWSRFVWNPNLGLVFIPLWFYTGLLAYHDGKRWAQIVYWLMLSANIQSQAVLVYLLPISLALFVWHLIFHEGRIRTIAFTIIGFILFAISLIPWGIGLKQYAVDNPDKAEAADVDGLLSSFNLDSLRDVPAIFGRIVGATDFPARELRWHPNPVGLWSQVPLNIVGWLSVTLAIMGGIWLLMRGLRAPKRHAPDFLIAGMSIVPFAIILFAAPDQPITDHFFIPVTFAASLIIGIFLAHIWQGSRIIAGGLLTIILTASLLLTASHLWWLHQHGFDHPNGNLGTISQEAEEFLSYGDVVIVVRQFSIDDTMPFRERFELNERLWTWIIMGSRYPITVLDTYGETLIVPQADRVAIVGRNGDSTFNAWFGQGDRVGYTDRYQVVTLAPNPDIMPNQFENLIRVLDSFNHAGLCAGAAGTVSLVWQPLVNQPENDYNFSVRLVDASGDVQAQVDVPTLYRDFWERDDWIVSHVELPASSNTVIEMHLIAYNTADAAGVDVVDADGNPNNYYIRLPLDCGD